MTPNTRQFDDPVFLDRLRNGDEAAYRALIRRFHTTLTHVATSIIGSKAQAEEVVQDAWLAVFSGIGRFEGRSSLTTWLFSIVLNRARTRISRESRTVGLPSILDGSAQGETAVPASAFKPDGHWLEVPSLWDEISPERIVAGRQIWHHVTDAIESLPAGQKAVITLRDLEGQDADTVCSLLEISAENQRVLLHRARSRVRQVIDGLLRAPSGRGAGRGGGPSRTSRTGQCFAFLGFTWRADLAHAIAAWRRPPRIARAIPARSHRWYARMKADETQTAQASLNSVPPSPYGSMPSGLAT